MIKYILDLIYRTKKNDLSNYISFIIDPNRINEPNVKISIIDTTNDSCKQFAEMIYSLNAGEYQQSITELLLNMGKQDAKIQKFVETTIVYWEYLMRSRKMSSSQSINDPLIMPTDFNKNAK